MRNGKFNNVQVKAIHTNLEQEIIQITEDKLRLLLSSYLSCLEERRGWIAPLGIFITIIVVFVTSTFKNAFFPAEAWQAFFMMGGVLTLLWLIKAIYKALYTKKIDDLIAEIKNSAPDVQ
ncbi:hypothetical protein [Aliivibrio fischeri]|uniref:hypothetical protein n=1 Tax=Aliivibrio fischeri TaxID=668 RepID=UPI0012DAAC74|nr:hypothetical protein [Aliivibrio fischeri]MUK67671.1 hypothetical protein [Aliivibrio fischeri]